MAGPTFGGTIELGGEKEYREAISKINKNLQILGSEMGKVNAEFSKEDKSIEALTARNSELSKQFDLQKSKVEHLRGALAQSTKDYGENNRKTQDWQISLNKAEAQLIKLDKELKNNNEILKSSANNTEKNSNSFQKLGENLKSAAKNAFNFGGVLKASLSSEAIKSSISFLVNGIKNIGKSLWDAAKSAGEYADKILKMSDKTGISTKTLQGFNAVSGRTGVNVETITKSLSKLTKSMDSSSKKTREQINSFAGINIKMPKSQKTTSYDVNQEKENKKRIESIKKYENDYKKALDKIQRLKEKADGKLKSADEKTRKINNMQSKEYIKQMIDSAHSMKDYVKKYEDYKKELSEIQESKAKSLQGHKAIMDSIGTITDEANKRLNDSIKNANQKFTESIKTNYKKVNKATEKFNYQIINNSPFKSLEKQTGSASEAFKILGVNVRDINGNLRDNQEVFWETVDALKNISNLTERNALAFRIFGKSAQELNPIINKGSKEFKDMTDNAEAMGKILDDDALTSLKNLKISADKVKSTFENIKLIIVASLAPALSEVSEQLNKTANAFTELVKTIIGGGSDEDIEKAIKKFENNLDELIKKLQKSSKIIAKLMGAIFNSLAKGFMKSLKGAMPKLIAIGIVLAGVIAGWSALMAAAIAAWPVTLAVAAVAAIYLLWPKIKEGLTWLQNKIDDWYKTTDFGKWDLATHERIQGYEKKRKENLQKSVDDLKIWWDKIKENFKNSQKELSENIEVKAPTMIFAKDAVNIAQKGKELADKFVQGLKTVGEKCKDFFKWIWDGANQGFNWFIEKIKWFANEIVNNLAKNIKLPNLPGLPKIKEYKVPNAYSQFTPDNTEFGSNRLQSGMISLSKEEFQNALNGMSFKIDGEKIGELIIDRVENEVFV